MPTLKITRIAYLIHAMLSALVIGLLTWATVASLRLEKAAQAEARARAEREHERSIQLAVYQIENLASAALGAEMLRPSSDYLPLYFPSTDEVRLHTGEVLSPGFLVEPSPLLLHPPENPWLLLHFQASPRGGYFSPQIIPDDVRRWPVLDDAYDAGARERFADVLAQLKYAYTVDELARKYEESGGYLTTDPVDDRPPPAQLMQQRLSEADFASNRSQYAQRRQVADLMNRAQVQQIECAPEDLADAQLHATSALPENAEANDPATLDNVVGITYRTMLPIWIKLANRSENDLAYLRAAHADGETAFQGFVVDWPECRKRLLQQVADRFPNARLEIIDPPPRPDDVIEDDTVLGVIPARFVANTQPTTVAATVWNTTHTFLLIGWLGSLLLLAGGALGIHSLVTLTERRTQFAYAVTHELRTPLTTFRLYTDMLTQGLVAESDRQSYLETLNHESQRLADLVSGVLEYSRVENNCVPLSQERISVAKVLEYVRDGSGQRCATAGMRLEIDPGDAAETELETDRHHLVQIIGNLVDNACKYGRNDADPVVRVSAARVNGSLHFDVTDRGCGVPPRMRHLIFKPYQRGDAPSVPATGGIGLGLALSRSWARLLGGNLELVPPARDEPGAHFRLSLPIRDA